MQLQARVFGNKAVGNSSRQNVCHDLLYQRLVIALLLLGFAVACQVNMHVYEARKQIGTLEVNGLAAGQIGFGLRRDIDDAPSLNHDHVIFKHLHALGSVEHVCVDVRHPPALGSGGGADLCHVRSLRFFSLTSALVCFVPTYHKDLQMKASHSWS